MFESSLIYLQSALKLLKDHYQLIIIPLLLGILGSVIDIFSGETLSILSKLIMLSVFVIMPLIYGRVNEIVTNSHFISWKYLFNKYFLKYLGLAIIIALIMCVPYILFSTLMIYIKAFRYPRIIFALIMLIYQLVGLYAVPLLFYDNTIKQSLSLGFKCLLGNLQYNLPIIIFLLLVTLFKILYTQSENEVISILYNCIRWGVLFVANFIIFIAITLILRDKIYSLQDL